jgi:putative membrane protein
MMRLLALHNRPSEKMNRNWNDRLPKLLGGNRTSKEYKVMNGFALTAVALIFAAPAWGQSATEKTGVNSVMGIAPTTGDFVLQAAQSDMFEIEASKLAAERADAPTKTFAQQMIADHQKTIDELKQLLGSGEVKATPPSSMAEAQQEMLDKLKSLQGAEFTEQYHSDQVAAHKDAVDLFKRYGDEGENAVLKAWAAKTRPALEHHLHMAEEMDK